MADEKPHRDDDLELIPPPGHEMVGHTIFNILEEILEHKEALGLPSKWNHYYQLRRNKHWKTGSNLSLISANVLGTHHQRTVNTLTDSNPTFNVVQLGPISEDPERTEEVLAQYMRTAEHWWTDQEQQQVLAESVSTGELCGCVAEKLYFDREKEFPHGEVVTETIDPFYVGWYPVKSKYEKAQAVLHFYALPANEAKRLWPEHAKKIVPDSELEELVGDRRAEASDSTSGKGGYKATISGVIRRLLLGGEKSTGKKGDEVVVVEAWVKDHRKGEDGTYINPGCIRRIQATNGGEVVLSDRPNPSVNPALDVEHAYKTYVWDKWPIIFAQSVTDAKNEWGTPDYEQLEGLQREINKTLSAFTMYKDKASRLKLINPKDSGVRNDELDDQAGIINPSSSFVAASLRYMDPPKAPVDLLNAIEIYKDFFFLVAGTFDLESAQTPGREVIAYKAIAALLENASRMLRDKIRNYSKMIRERGRIYIGLAQNWYTEERWIEFTKDGKKTPMSITGKQLIIPAKLTVVSGSTMPRSQIQIREEALALFQQGAIDDVELLKKLDWDDWQAVVERKQAGVIGGFLQKLIQAGLPQELAQMFQEIAKLDDKQIAKAIATGEVPPLAAVIQQAMSGQAPAEQDQEQAPEQPTAVDEAEVELKREQTRKVRAETDLIQEKIVTERVEQQVRLAGVKLDEQKMDIDRAKVVADLRKAVADEEAMKSGKGKSAQGPYREKGMKSNNKEVTGK